MTQIQKTSDSESAAQRILRNATYLMGSQLATWSMTVVSIVIIPRYLGAERLGDFSLAESIWLIAAGFTLFGLTTHLTKSIARTPENLSALFGTAWINVGLNFLLTFGGVLLYSWLSGYSPTRIQLIAIMGIGSFAFSTIELATSALAGLEQMGYISSIATINRAIYTVFAITTLLLGGSLIQYALVVVVAAVIGAILMVSMLYRAQPFSIRFDFSLSKELYREGAPYFLTMIFAMLYKEFDIVIMSWLLPDANQFGWYAAADRLFGTMMFLPHVLVTALFPALSRMHGEGSDLLPTYVSKSFNLLFLVSVPVGLGISAIAEPVIGTIYGQEFIEAAQILKVLGFVLILTYQTTLLGQFLISVDKQRLWTITMMVATLATIPLDLILVPYANSFGPAGVGGAMAYLFTEGGMMVAGLYFLPKGFITKANIVLALKTILAGAVMYAAVMWVNRYGLAPGIISGAIIYPIVILLLKTIPAEDIQLFKSAAAPITNRLSKFKKSG